MRTEQLLVNFGVPLHLEYSREVIIHRRGWDIEEIRREKKHGERPGYAKDGCILL